LVILYFNKPTILSDIINRASYNTRFRSTYFEIFDKSTPEICNRLIRVRPFDWLIWAIFGSVYVLGESVYSCEVGNTPAVKIPYEILEEDEYNFQSVCMGMNLIDIINLYSGVGAVLVDYIIPDNATRFTVLDALNILFNGFITMTPPMQNIVDSLSLNIVNGKYAQQRIKRDVLDSGIKSKKYSRKILEDMYTRAHSKQNSERTFFHSNTESDMRYPFTDILAQSVMEPLVSVDIEPTPLVIEEI